ncbi:hypothetical protein BC833DRAFT_532379 [Globomyces pollinis-pini]|nr:hypothetical protein BC833DRAFT_532379 [Globomyces pollinis-pini]
MKEQRRREAPFISDSSVKSSPLVSVQLDALVVLKIIKHCKSSQLTNQANTVANGQILGVDEYGTLRVSNSFPLPEVLKADDDEVQENNVSNYRTRMLETLSNWNYESNRVGWYQSAPNGIAFCNEELIETQYNEQSAFPQSVHLILSDSITAKGPIRFSAVRLTDDFMKFYKEKKFSMKAVATMNLNNIFETLPVTIKNSSLLSAMFYEIKNQTVAPEISSCLIKDPLFTPVVWNPELSSESSAEKQLEYLTEAVEFQGQENWRWQNWHRQLNKEQQKVLQSIHKMNQEGDVNAESVPKEELVAQSPSIIKLQGIEPPRFESLILDHQISTYCEQILGFSGMNERATELVE